MRIVLAGLVFLAGPGAAQQGGDPDANPEVYWSRGWNCGQSAENYQVTITVDNPGEAFLKVDAVMTGAGAITQSANYSGYQENGSMRQMQYSLPIKAGEKAAKKVWELGELTSYSVNRVKTDDSIRAIDERVRVLEKELADPAVEKLSAARYFLKTKLASLRQAKESCVRGADRASLTVGLQPKAKPARP